MQEFTHIVTRRFERHLNIDSFMLSGNKKAELGSASLIQPLHVA